ncbi:hypothetical protein FKG96_09880 [Olivibacter sp. LS-1]|uniref:hypothetical protein n=1 Tax=Olivibacter sp. LS-1 TaxID=2592345 RepID=UPI0011EAAD85|nr:hypothetical protein [Olivibacter sp. LS-1]QEL01102.1 hypothetical protein FKG96_09880 [Olivibacter sp. LS-1]
MKRNVELHGTPGATVGDHVVFDKNFYNISNGIKVFENLESFKEFLCRYYEFEKVSGHEDFGGNFLVYKITKVI